MRIDFRIRPPFKSFLPTHLFAPRDPDPDPVGQNGLMMNMPAYRSFDERSMDAFLEEMDAARIDVGVVVGRVAPAPYGAVDNADIAELVATWPDRFIGFGGIDYEVGDFPAQVDAIAELGFKGIGLDSPWAGLYDDDPALFPLYERAQERGLIVMITSSIFLGPDLSYSDPVHIQQVARAFPDLTIVVSHACWPWTTNASAVAFAQPNVYLMPDIYWNIPSTPGSQEYVRSANYFLSHRILHASAYPVRPLDDSIDGLLQLPFASDEIRDRILGGNAARLLGLDASAARFPTEPAVPAAESAS